MSNENPFEKLPEETSVGIDKSMHDFRFTRRWFRHRNQATWSTFFLKKFSNDRPMNMIQIGVFEGMDLVWCLQNILGHTNSRVLAIDPWIETTKLDADYMNDVHDRAVHNLMPWRKKHVIMRGFSQNILPNISYQGIEIRGQQVKTGQFDLIVIDGDHNADAVYMDAILSLRLIKPGGWMVFDDVRNRIPKKDHVQAGLDRFLGDHQDRVRTVWKHRYCDCVEKIE